ncbi:FeoA family protein [Limosilactobacillus difficilis]|uniref:FeoA family protein n=1 Tax=Limosilactobacillus difficilis TaxID=2991838 RepID=UPI0024BA6D88|nr:FeoA family protein [Limosilactobacillus difficilis]
MNEVKNNKRIISHLERLAVPVVRRLHDLGLHNGVKVRVVRQFPLHGPVVIEYQRQRIGLRYPLFASITVSDHE